MSKFDEIRSTYILMARAALVSEDHGDMEFSEQCSLLAIALGWAHDQEGEIQQMGEYIDIAQTYLVGKTQQN